MAHSESTDVVVIGAGIVGCATAYFLTKRGFTVTICEASTVASGATGLASGGVRTQFATELETRMTLRTKELWRDFEQTHGVNLGYHRSGYTTIASDEATADELTRRRPMQREVGINAVELDHASLDKLVPGINADGIHMAVYTPDDGFGSPADVTNDILTEARKLGAVLRQQTRVHAVSGDDSSGYMVELDGADPIGCRAVVSCAGLGSPGIGESVGLYLPVSAYRQHQFLTEPITDLDLDRLPNVLDPALDLYFRREGRGVLLGISDAAEAGRTDLSITWSLLEPLAERLEQRWPQLDAGIASGYVGCYEVTPDRRALIGGEDGLFYAAGFSGHGFMHGFAAGETMAALVAGEAPRLDMSELSASRFTH